MKYGRGDGGGLEPIVSTDAVRMLSVVMWIACIVLYSTVRYARTATEEWGEVMWLGWVRCERERE